MLQIMLLLRINMFSYRSKHGVYVQTEMVIQGLFSLSYLMERIFVI